MPWIPFCGTYTAPYEDYTGRVTIGSFYERRSYGDAYLVHMYWGTTITEEPPLYGTIDIGSFLYPNGLSNVLAPGVNYGMAGTLRLMFCCLKQSSDFQKYQRFIDSEGGESSYSFDNKIQTYDKLALTFEDDGGFGGIDIEVSLPALGTGTTVLYVDTLGRTFTDEGYNYLACGRRTIATYLESVGVSQGGYDFYDKVYFSEDIPIAEKSNHAYLHMPIEFISIADDVIITDPNQSHLDWQFAPTYKLLFNDGVNVATTNWDSRVKDWGVFNKQAKYWSNDYEVGNTTIELADVDNELYGSLHSNDTSPIGKTISILARYNTLPEKWAYLFSGKISNARWSDGLLTVSLKDEIKQLPYRKYVFDYKCIGTVVNSEQYGIVKKIIGTDVMFDDMCDIQYITRKSKQNTNWMSIAIGAVETGVGVALGNYWLAGAGVYQMAREGLVDHSDKVVSAYYAINDSNLIPDDTIANGNVLNFLPSMVDAIATNSSGYFANKRGYVTNGGTFRQGKYGTVGLDTVAGINIGDYVYVRRPIIYSGNPLEIIKALLTGSNVDNPYEWNHYHPIVSWNAGSPRVDWKYDGDFGTNIETELNRLNLLNLSYVVDPNSTTTPFDALKEALNEIGVSMYINESNKFIFRLPQPLGLGTESSSIATYSQNINILDEFSYEEDSSDLYAGYHILYGYSGESFSKELTTNFGIGSQYPYKEFQYKWLWNIDDIKSVLWRQRGEVENAPNRINFQTSLYGLLTNLGDLINITHNTGSLTNEKFFIENYSKRHNDSKVEISAININRNYGYGNTRWGYDGNEDVSGFSCYYNRISPIGTLGTLTEHLNAFGTEIYVSGIESTPMENCIGVINYRLDNYFSYCDFVLLKSFQLVRTSPSVVFKVIVERGLFGVSSNDTHINWNTLDHVVYYIGYPQYDKNGKMIDIIHPRSYNTINPNLGTSFNFS